MRIIKSAALDEYAQTHSRARTSLAIWAAITKHAQWSNYTEVRYTFNSADPVTLKSGRTVTVFNIAGNDFRLITAIHYTPANPQKGRVYIREFLTHAEYTKGEWKERH
jgi:mRNA interferase HigB